MHLLSVIGPWQIAVLLIPILIIVGLIVSRAKHKAKADALDSVLIDKSAVLKKELDANKEVLEQLEKLNQLKESGAITQEEFEAQKARLL